MATSSDDGDRKKAALSQPLTEDERSIFYMEILTFDLLVNILCRLPVKVLMKLRCVCKFWNSFISDPKFAKEHLRLSRTLLNRHHLLSCRSRFEGGFLVWDSGLPSVFNSSFNTIRETQLTHPLPSSGGDIIGSCDGITCFRYYNKEGDFDSILVWNPSIRNFKILPPWRKELQLNAAFTTFGFGYDRITDSYKVVVVCCYEIEWSNYVCKTQVMVHTLGTDTWTSIQSFSSALPGLHVNYSGKFVSGAINWLFRTAPSSWVIVALDLGNETSQELLLPNYGGEDACLKTMGVLRDCLCILAHIKTFGIHVWLMNDYGNIESWTQLFAIPYNDILIDSHSLNFYTLAFPHYILEDDQLLMDFGDKVFVYNPRIGTVKIPEIQYNDSDWYDNHVYIESLISP